MTAPQLFPRHPKRLRQPSKELMREELRRAADRIIAVQAENERLKSSWWRRIIRSK